MLVDEAKGAMMPCSLDVQTADLKPVKIETPSPVADGRYELLAPAWTGTAIRVNGAWEVTNLKPHEHQSLPPAERKAGEKKVLQALKNNPVVQAAARAAMTRAGRVDKNNPPKPKHPKR